nr:hypothetical protein [Tanacetum cinerariifolium]
GHFLSKNVKSCLMDIPDFPETSIAPNSQKANVDIPELDSTLRPKEADLIKMERRRKRRVKAMRFPSSECPDSKVELVPDKLFEQSDSYASCWSRPTKAQVYENDQYQVCITENAFVKSDLIKRYMIAGSVLMLELLIRVMKHFTSQDTMKMDCIWRLQRSKDTSFQDCDSSLTLRGLSAARINKNDPLSIRANGRNYNVRFAHVEIGAGTDVFKYQLREEDCESLVEDIGLEAGMFVVFTKHRFNRLGLMAFDTDGNQMTIIDFVGVTNIKKVAGNDAIKASFLANNPMHQHRKVLVKHQGIEYEMKMKMDYHKEKPERTNHVGIYGKWKQFGRECGFEHDKMLRIHYIGTARQLDRYDEEDEILNFHVC